MISGHTQPQAAMRDCWQLLGLRFKFVKRIPQKFAETQNISMT